VERVLEILERLQNIQSLSPLKDDLEWVVDVIIGNNLYKISVDSPLHGEEILILAKITVDSPLHGEENSC
jgi:hypothetical protein